MLARLIRLAGFGGTEPTGDVQSPYFVKTKKTKLKISAKLRSEVWRHWMTEKGCPVFEGLCWCCGLTLITPFTFEAGHVVSEASGGPTCLSNLRPCCSLCNKSCGRVNMAEFAKKNGFNGKISS